MSHFGVLDVVPLRDDPPPLACALVEARFNSGTHDLYQLLVGPREDGVAGDAIDVIDGEVFDALADPADAVVLARLMQRSARSTAPRARCDFHWTGAVAGAVGRRPRVRPMGAEQSNSTIVLDDALALKVFRRLLPGDNPELEMLRFLSAHGFENIAPLAGWYEFSGERMEATLGVLQRFVADGRDGWDFALAEPGGVPRARRRARRGHRARCTRCWRRTLSDPDFAPEEPGDEALGLLTRRSTRRSSGSSSTCRDDDERVARRSSAAARRCATGCRCSRTRAPAGG